MEYGINHKETLSALTEEQLCKPLNSALGSVDNCHKWKADTERVVCFSTTQSDDPTIQ